MEGGSNMDLFLSGVALLLIIAGCIAMYIFWKIGV
jgi:hypothetical protein